MKNKRDKKNYINVYSVLVCIVVAGSVITKFVMDYISKQPNIFHDFLVGIPAYYGTNKTGEWTFFWVILLLGMLLAFILSFLDHTDVREKQEKPGLSYALIAFYPMLLQLMIYGQTAACFVVISVLFFVIIFVYRKAALIRIADFLKIYFAWWTVSVLLSVGAKKYFFGDYKVLAASVFAFLVLCVAKSYGKEKDSGQSENEKCDWLRHRKSWFYYFNIGMQMLHPLLLLVYLKQDYNYNGQVMTLPYHKTYVTFIGILILTLLLSNIYSIWQENKRWRMHIREHVKGDNTDCFYRDENRTFFATAYSVFAFVSYISPALIMQTDLHHHGEQILAFQQIVELGQKPFVDYYPASGMFPMVIGATVSLLFGQTAISYGMSYVLTALIFELLIMYLLYKRVGGHPALVIAMIFHMPVYCRTWILLPALLILFHKSLQRENAIWLFVWVLVCYGCGLYYPLFGAGILLATLPLGISKLIQYIKNKEWKKRDLILIGILCVLIIPAIPFLFRMMKHILSMSSETLNVDGIPVWDSELPGWFMPYISDMKKKEVIYHLVRLLLGCVFVWLFTYLLGRYINMNKKKDKNNAGCLFMQSGFFAFLSIPILLCVCYSYTMVCMDEDWVGNLLSRSDHVIIWICGIWGFMVIREFGGAILKEKQKIALSLMMLCTPFLFFVRCEDYHFPVLEGTTDSKSYVVGEYAAKLEPFTVRQGQVLVTPDIEEKYEFVEFERIGKGFIYESVLEKLNQYEAVMMILRQYDPQIQLLGFEESQFYYYLMNEKCVYSGRTAIAKSKETSKLVMQAVDIEHTAVRSGVTPLEQYYLYRYFERAGYQYAADLDVFIPQKLYHTIYKSEGSKANSVWTNSYDGMYVAASYGKSIEQIENLKQVYISCAGVASWPADEKNTLEIKLSEPVAGADADFIYIVLDHVMDGKATIAFSNEEPLEGNCEEYFSIGDGRLLIPIGTNANWLDGTHDSITISFEEPDASDKPVLRELEFYQLTE